MATTRSKCLLRVLLPSPRFSSMLFLSFLPLTPLFGSEPATPSPKAPPRNFTTPDGIRIEIQSDRKDLNQEDLARVLEKYARELRGLPGPDVLEYVPVPGSAPPTPSPAPSARRAFTPAEMAIQEMVVPQGGPPIPPRGAIPTAKQVPARPVAIPVPQRIPPEKVLDQDSPPAFPESDPLLGNPAPAEAPLPSTMPSLAQLAADSNGFYIEDGGSGSFEPVPTWVLLPRTLLWTPPLANPLEPRMYAKVTTLDNANSRKPIDTAIGGTLGLVRYHPTGRNDQAWQIDFFAVAFSRWDKDGEGVGEDYRVGIPITFARGPWEGKISYEHTSTHLSDEFIERTGRPRISNTRDEIVLGLAYRFLEDFRAYGILGFALSRHIPGDDKSPLRFDCGLEWCTPCPTGWKGRPFVALDLEFRGEQDHNANFNSQIGWMWRGNEFGRALRIALEYYTGRSTYGQFYLDRENWLGLALLYDF